MTLLNNRYEIIEALGEGGFGITWLALDTHTQRRCVVKQMKLQQTRNWKSVEIFQREAKVLSKLNHDKIPDFYDAFEIQTEDELQLYLVHAYVEGKNLREWIQSGRSFTEAEVLDIGLQCSEVLEYLHGFNPPFIHRDLKPTNLILDQDNTLHLIDFGAVKESAQVATQDTALNVGTFGYMPAEQYEGKASPASDLYGLGATLSYMLAAKEPSEMAMIELRPEIESHITVSDGLQAVLIKLLQADWQDRYTDAKSLSSDFKRMQQGQPPAQARLGKKKRFRFRSKMPLWALLLAIPITAGSLVSVNVIKRLIQGDFVVEKSRYAPWEPIEMQIHNPGVDTQTIRFTSPQTWPYLSSSSWDPQANAERPRTWDLVSKETKKITLCAPDAPGDYQVQLLRDNQREDAPGAGANSMVRHFRVTDDTSQFPRREITGLKNTYPPFSPLSFQAKLDNTTCAKDVWGPMPLRILSDNGTEVQRFPLKNSYQSCTGFPGSYTLNQGQDLLPESLQINQRFQVTNQLPSGIAQKIELAPMSSGRQVLQLTHLDSLNCLPKDKIEFRLRTQSGDKVIQSNYAGFKDLCLPEKPQTYQFDLVNNGETIGQSIQVNVPSNGYADRINAPIKSVGRDIINAARIPHSACSQDLRLKLRNVQGRVEIDENIGAFSYMCMPKQGGLYQLDVYKGNRSDSLGSISVNLPFTPGADYGKNCWQSGVGFISDPPKPEFINSINTDKQLWSEGGGTKGVHFSLYLSPDKVPQHIINSHPGEYTVALVHQNDLNKRDLHLLYEFYNTNRSGHYIERYGLRIPQFKNPKLFNQTITMPKNIVATLFRKPLYFGLFYTTRVNGKTVTFPVAYVHAPI